MPRPGSEYPTALELQILKVLWERSPLTVREVRDALDAGGRPLAHTTVITMLSTMVDRGQLERLDPLQGKAFRFVPRIDREDVSKGKIALKEFNETSVWLRMVWRAPLMKQEWIEPLVDENQQLCRILDASVKTAQAKTEAAN